MKDFNAACRTCNNLINDNKKICTIFIENGKDPCYLCFGYNAPKYLKRTDQNNDRIIETNENVLAQI